MRKSEVTGVAKILVSDNEYDSPEDAAKAIINWLDEDRAKRTSYVAVMQFGESGPFYVGLGPYPGQKSAINAAQDHPAAGEAFRVVVVPVSSPEGVEKMKSEIDEYRKGMNA